MEKSFHDIKAALAEVTLLAHPLGAAGILLAKAGASAGEILRFRS
jgi:hypothetical protein